MSIVIISRLNWNNQKHSGNNSSLVTLPPLGMWESILMNVCNIFWCRNNMGSVDCETLFVQGLIWHTQDEPIMALIYGMFNVLYCAAFEVDVRLIYWILMTWHSLVVEDNVWSPDVVSWHVQTLDPAILLGLPGQLVVSPVLLHPQVGRHNLVLQILKSVECHLPGLTFRVRLHVRI